MLDRTNPEPTQTGIVPRATVEAIVAQRNRTLALYGEAYLALTASMSAIEKAHEACFALRHRETSYNYHLHEEKVHFMSPVKLAEREIYLTQARKIADTEAWSYIIGITDLERLMDKQAKDELRQQLLTNPPEITVENIYATLEQFLRDAGMIFKRGIANCFTKLERRFRSHDGWKIGARVILTNMYDSYGFQNHRTDMESVLRDIERTFFVLDNRKVPESYTSIVQQLSASRYTGNGPRQGEVESEFFTVRVFKNGNCHVWFKRDDLLVKVNKLLGEYYGAPIPEEREPEEDTGLNRPKTTLAKNYGFFPTPNKPAEDLIEMAPLYREKGKPRPTVLEPSAGTGNLARRLVEKGAIVDCIEVQPELASQLASTKKYRTVTLSDFLRVEPNPDALYDLVVMNPPFDLERDIDHVMHALKFLKPEGCLVAIMSAGTELRETKKSIAFRALMKKMNARFSDLPAGSFSSVGTNVNTITLKVWADGRHFYN